MTTFDQRNQNVHNQINIEARDIHLRDINIGPQQCSKEDIISILNSLKQDFDQSVQDNIIDVEIGNEANTQLQRALTEFQKEEPNKQIILDSIDNTKKITEGVMAASGLITQLIKVFEIVQKIL